MEEVDSQLLMTRGGERSTGGPPPGATPALGMGGPLPPLPSQMSMPPTSLPPSGPSGGYHPRFALLAQHQLQQQQPHFGFRFEGSGTFGSNGE